MDTKWSTKKVRRLVQESLTVADRNAAGLRFDDWLSEVQAEAWEWGQIQSGTAATNPYRKDTHG